MHDVTDAELGVSDGHGRRVLRVTSVTLLRFPLVP
jgi:hypothetical protein